MRTIIYARVSTEDQAEKYGLPSQIRACREYAKNHGLNVIKVIEDDCTGTILNRPGLNQVRAMISAGEADVLLMFDADRLSRELAHLLILKPEIERKARLEFVAARFEDSPSGRLFFGIRGVIAQYEREVTRERTMRGKRERARAGLIVGGRIAYGYRYVEGKLVPDEQRASIVREIFSRYDAGESMRSIAIWLRNSGAPTWSGKQWGHSSVRRILVNETYAGVAYYGTHRRDGKVLRLRTPAERIALSVPALIKRALWERVQHRIAENPSVGRRSVSYLLRGLLRCSCGRRMTGEIRRTYRSYRCSGRDQLRFRGPKCRCSVGAGRLDTAVWQALVNVFTDSKFLRDTLVQNERQLRTDGAESLAMLKQQAQKFRRKEDAALLSLLDPDLSSARPTIKKRYQEFLAERLRVEEKIAARVQTTKPSMDWVESTVQLLRQYIPTLTTPEQKHAFVQKCVTAARWDGADSVEVDCFLKDSELSTTFS